MCASIARAVEQQLQIWEATASGATAEGAYRAAKLITEQAGFRYLPASRVADLPVADIVARLDAAVGPDGELDSTITHVATANRIMLKTDTSRRVVPLAGVSLEASRQCPEGFPCYRDTATLSDTVNKYLRANKLLQTEQLWGSAPGQGCG